MASNHDQEKAGISVSKNIDHQSENAQQVTHPSPSPFPEGGYRAWSTLLGACLVQFCTFGYTNAFGVYQDFYVREYMTNKTSSQISLIGSVQLLLALSVGLVTGRLFDKGYFHHLMIGGAILSCLCLFMLSLSEPQAYYQVFLSQGLGQGIAIGMTFLPSVGIVAHYFQRRRGFAMGLVVSGASLGGMLHPIMLNHLFFGPVGFHTGVRASAGMNLGLLFVANLMMRTRLPPRKDPNSLPIASFFQDVPYILTITGSFLVMSGLFFPIFFLQLDAVEHGIGKNLAFYTIAILNGASVAGRIVPSLLVQRFGVYNLIAPCTTICGILILCLLAIHNTAGVVIFAIFYGFFSGAFVSLLSPMLSSLARNFSEIGARMGICFTFTGIAGFIGTPIAGALLSHSYIWWRPTAFAGIVVISGAMLLLVARLLLSQGKNSQII